MFSFKENQRAYLPAWEYNTCRVLGALAEIIENNGGKVKPFRHVLANNRTYEPDAEPVLIYGQGYITFTYGGDLYSFHIQDNPFFEHCYTKLKIQNGFVPRGNQVYMAEIDRKAWMFDCLFRTACDADIREIAELLFNELVKAPYSRVETKRHRRTVTGWDGKRRYEYTAEPIEYVDAEGGWEE